MKLLRFLGRLFPSPHTHVIPAGIWYLGLANLLMNVSSVIAFTLAPLFLRNVLGTSMATLGIFEGIVEAMALFTRIFSGVLSDIARKRKSFIALGYVLSILARALLAVASTVGWVFVSRVFDRISNGIQASPRDALVSDLAPSDIKGTCYGLRHAMSVLGSVIGAGLGIFLMWSTANNYRFVFWMTVIPGILGFIFLMTGVQEPAKKEHGKQLTKSFRFPDLLEFSFAYWKLIGVTLFFMVGHFSGAFLIITAENNGISEALIPAVMVWQNLVTVMVAVPCGKISDRFDRRWVLALGFMSLMGSNITLGLSTGLWGVLLGIGLCGLQMGVTQSTLLAFVAETTPPHLRGTGFGVFHFASGIGVLIANTLMGSLWDGASPQIAYLSTAVLVFIGLLGVPWLKKPPPKRQKLPPIDSSKEVASSPSQSPH